MAESVPATDRAPSPVLLVVEEEDGVRRLLELALSRFGFTVVTANNGVDALHIFQDRGTVIDIVLMDVRACDLSDPRTLTRLKDINPKVRCCFMSGDASVNNSGELDALGALRVFHKPFSSMRELADGLRALLP